MSKEFVPPGWDQAAVLAGLRQAMGFGRPTRVEDRATFYLPPTAATIDPILNPTDSTGVPFSPEVIAQRPSTLRKIAVACAVEFYDGGLIIEQFGDARPTRIKITLLDPEYQQVKDFRYVVAGGDKYIRAKVEPPVALGTIDVWSCWADAENER